MQLILHPDLHSSLSGSKLWTDKWFLMIDEELYDYPIVSPVTHQIITTLLHFFLVLQEMERKGDVITRLNVLIFFAKLPMLV